MAIAVDRHRAITRPLSPPVICPYSTFLSSFSLLSSKPSKSLLSKSLLSSKSLSTTSLFYNGQAPSSHILTASWAISLLPSLPCLHIFNVIIIIKYDDDDHTHVMMIISSWWEGGQFHLYLKHIFSFIIMIFFLFFLAAGLRLEDPENAL